MSYQEDFIEKIAPIVQKMTAFYGYGVNSAIIGQACLESAYGQSGKAKHHNYFGLKYRPDRVKCFSGTFTDGSSEQLANGQYIPITDRWYAFSSMESGVEGYLQFISIPNYEAARMQRDPRRYLLALKEAGYATSQTYVDNVMAVVNRYNLTKYDGKAVDVQKGAIKVIQKPTITKMISKYNHESRSGQAIIYIVLHYTGNQTDTAKANANYFATGDRGASAHYFVDSSSIWQSVEDTDAAWHVGKNYGSNNLFGKCTNKNSIGIEMCSSKGIITSNTVANAVALTRYLMALYGIKADHVVRHYDVCSKRCPGWTGWLPPDESIWKAFKAQLDASEAAAPATTTTTTSSKTQKVKTPFLIKVKIRDLCIRKGAGTKYDKVRKANGKELYTGKGKFTIVETNKAMTWGRLKSGAGWVYIGYQKWTKWPV